MGAWITRSVGAKYAPTVAARRWQANLGALSPEEAYEPLRKTPELFESLLRDDWLAPSLRDVVTAARRGECHRDLVEEAPGVFSFELFSDAFCAAFLDEVDHYRNSGLPIRRPNSMNNYGPRRRVRPVRRREGARARGTGRPSSPVVGLIVNEIGMRGAIDQLQREVLLPIARSLWPREASSFHTHHSFMVQYKKSEDPGLDMHTDDSDVTFNVCLGKRFSGAGLTFCGGMGQPDHRQFSFNYRHKKGRAVVHLGTKRHGADDIQSGERRNLIIWNHNRDWRLSDEYAKRSQRYQRESAPPDARCLSYTHDRDFGDFKAYPPGTEDKARRAWCPPPRACYDRMGEEPQ